VYNWQNILTIFDMIRESYGDKDIDWAAVYKCFRCVKVARKHWNISDGRKGQR
jgi:hypothetical protein